MSEYIRKKWTDGEIITSEALNNIEAGIAETKNEVAGFQIASEESSKEIKKSIEEITKGSTYTTFKEIEDDIVVKTKEQQEALEAQYTQLTGYTDAKIAELVNGAPTTLDTLKEVADAMKENEDVVRAIEESIGKKANEEEVDSHTNNAVIHVGSDERTNWNDANEKKHTHSNASVLENTTASFTVEEKEKLDAIAEEIKNLTDAFDNLVNGNEVAY